MIKITLPDGAVREYDKGISAFDVAKSISEGLARKVLAANITGRYWMPTGQLKMMLHLNCLPGMIQMVKQLFGIHRRM